MTLFSILSLGLLTLALSAQGMYDPNNQDMNNGSGMKIMGMGIMSNDPTPTPPPVKTKEVYFDWTRKIDSRLGNEEDEEPATGALWKDTARDGKKRPLPNIFYSTDSMVSNLEELSTVTDLLDENGLEKSPVHLSFNLIKDGHISDEHLADVFYSIQSSIPEEKLKSLKKHISGILLDAQTEGLDCTTSAYDYAEYKRHFASQSQSKSDLLKWDIPFPKYAKQIFHKLMGQDDPSSPPLQVGVIINETQNKCFQLAHQLKGADYVVININFEPVRTFPLTYKQFSDYLEQVERDHLQGFLSSIRGYNKTKVMFKISLNPPGVPDHRMSLSENVPSTAAEIVEESQFAYFPILKKFAAKWTLAGKTDLILSQNLNVSCSEEREGGRSFHGKDWFIPYLYLQEVDVNPCQLNTMLAETASQFGSLVVNEFTWSAFARHANDMTSKKCPKAIDLPGNSPTIYLLFTPGIGALWNKTEQYFERLLQEHQTISRWELSTLVFSGRDVKRSTCEGNGDDCNYNYYSHEDATPDLDQGIPKFAMQMKEKYKIGCLVEFTNPLTSCSLDPVNFARHSQISCTDIWDMSSVIIWQFSTPFGSEINRGLNFKFQMCEMKYNLLQVLSERDDFLKLHPDKEVIIQIVMSDIDQQLQNQKRYRQDIDPKDLLCNDHVSKELQQFYKGIQTWAGIHGIKVILSPAYDVQDPEKGLRLWPKEDGSPNTFSMADCQNNQRGNGTLHYH